MNTNGQRTFQPATGKTHGFTIAIDAITRAELLDNLTRVLTETPYENRNRVEAVAVARAMALKAFGTVEATIRTKRAKQTAPASITI